MTTPNDIASIIYKNVDAYLQKCGYETHRRKNEHGWGEIRFWKDNDMYLICWHPETADRLGLGFWTFEKGSPWLIYGFYFGLASPIDDASKLQFEQEFSKIMQDMPQYQAAFSIPTPDFEERIASRAEVLRYEAEHNIL